MSDQHRRIHWDKDEPLQGNHFQSQGTETDEWDATDYVTDSSLEALGGKIVARMPDLGECPMISSSSSARRALPIRLADRLYSVGRPVFQGIGRTVMRPFTRKRKSDPVEEPENNTIVVPGGVSRKTLYARLITVGVILLICGVFLTAKGVKKKQTEIAKKVPTSVEAVQAVPAPKVTEDKGAAEKAEAAKAAAEKTAADKATAEKAAIAKAAADKAAAAKAAADKAAAEKAKAAKAAAEKAAAQAAKDPNSPWDRPVTDSYSPWTMTSMQRLDAAAENAAKEEQNAAGVAVTAVPAPAPAPAASLQAMGANTSASPDPGVPMMSVPVTVQQAGQTPGVNSPIPNAVPSQTVPQPMNRPMTAAAPPDSRGFASTSQFSRAPVAYPSGPGYVAAPAYPAVARQPYAQQPYAPAAPNYANQSVAAASGRLPIAESPQTYQGTPALAAAAPRTPVAGYPTYQVQPAPQAYVQAPVSQPVYAQPTQPVPTPPSSYQQATYQAPIPSGPATAYPTTPFYSTYPSATAPAYQQGGAQQVVPNGRIY